MTVDERLQRILRDEGPGLGRVAALYARSRVEEEDLRQEIVFAIWRALPAFRGDCSERSFAYRIAHNLGQKQSLGRRRQVALEEAELPPAAEADPERSAEARLRYRKLLAALAGMQPSARQVVALALEGFSHAEIGEVVGASAGAVAVRLHRAREELRKRLEEAR
ncbi:RNA polymerase sigma factor [Vulgatibacter sp.]|uniref:RNA polymerase sigma factor n=1 Tax=Vulgatibacter sp. TaxID=1971226 RepID=UPI003568E6A4